MKKVAFLFSLALIGLVFISPAFSNAQDKCAAILPMDNGGITVNMGIRGVHYIPPEKVDQAVNRYILLLDRLIVGCEETARIESGAAVYYYRLTHPDPLVQQLLDRF